MATWEVAPGLVALAMSGAVAWYVRRARPGATQNRRLSRTLVLLGLSAATFPTTWALANAQEDFWDSIGLILFGLVAFVVVTLLLVAQWLGVVATLETPLARPVRRWFVRYGGVAATVALVAIVSDAASAGPGFAAAALLPAYCLAAAGSAYQRARGGSLEASRARAFAVAFVIIVAAFLVLGGTLALAEGDIQDHIMIWVWPLAVGVFAGLTGYGQLNPQRFDLPLKLKVGIRRSTVVGMVVTAALATFGIVQEFSTAKFGAVAAILVPAVLYPARKSLERIGDKVSDKALPDVKDTPEYRAMRKVLVYRAAVEAAVRDGLTESETHMLTMLREELGLPPEIWSQVEREAGRPADASPGPAAGV